MEERSSISRNVKPSRWTNEDQENGAAQKRGKGWLDMQGGRCRTSGSQVCSLIYSRECVFDDVTSAPGEKMTDRAASPRGELEFFKETIMLQGSERSLKVIFWWYWIPSAPASEKCKWGLFLPLSIICDGEMKRGRLETVSGKSSIFSLKWGPEEKEIF